MDNVERALDAAERVQAWNRICDELATEILCRFAEVATKHSLTSEQQTEAFHEVLTLAGRMLITWHGAPLIPKALNRTFVSGCPI